VILIVAAVLMFATAGVFAGLYVAEESDHDKAVSVLDEKKATLADVKKNITSAEEDKSTAEDQNSDLESKNSALSPCVEATQHFLWDTLSDAELTTAIDAMESACT
jgi:predicted Zn-dependent peptidase